MDKKAQLEIALNDISEYVQSVLLYLTSEGSTELDKSEIVMYLNTVPEIIQEIKRIIKN